MEKVHLIKVITNLMKSEIEMIVVKLSKIRKNFNKHFTKHYVNKHLAAL